MYQTFIFGANALGSLAWGSVAERFGIPASLTGSGVMLLVGCAAGLAYRLREPTAAALFRTNRGSRRSRQWI